MFRSVLLAQNQQDFDVVHDDAIAELQALLGDGWACRAQRTEYTPGNHSNIWTNELRGRLRALLEREGVSEADYASWLGQTHFVRLIGYSTLLFNDGYRDNQGWRILALGVPAASVVCVGLASNYQNAQNHNRLGDASNTFFDHVSAVCETREIAPAGRKVSAEDWDKTGLIDEPIFNVAGVDISGLEAEPAGLWLKDVRTTTLKKTVASFMAICPISLSGSTDDDLRSELVALREVAGVLLAPPA